MRWTARQLLRMRGQDRRAAPLKARRSPFRCRRLGGNDGFVLLLMFPVMVSMEG